jgi:streptogramin lyase
VSPRPRAPAAPRRRPPGRLDETSAVKRWLLLLGLLPVAAATAIAGVVSNPSDVRPCFEEFTKGVNGGPTHLILGPGGNLFATEEPQKKILRFNPDTHKTKEFKVPEEPHDLTTGPDGRVWFVSATGKPTNKYLGALNTKTGKVTMYPGIAKGAEPHMLRWDRGKLYITLQKAGQLAIFDPKTEKFKADEYGLPVLTSPHNIVVLPNGDIWAVLQEGDALARFNFKKQKFDKLVDIPELQGGPRDITYVKKRNALFATLFAANKLVEYDLDTGKLTIHETHLDPISYDVAISRQPKAKLTFVRPDAQEKAVWVATLAGGELLRFDLTTEKFERVGCGVEIPGGPLGIATDRKGRLWTVEPFPGRVALVKQ